MKKTMLIIVGLLLLLQTSLSQSGFAANAANTEARGNNQKWVDATTAEVKFEVASSATGSYQLLLDSTCTMAQYVADQGWWVFESDAFPTGDAPAGFYDKFKYKLPANADGSTSTSNVVVAPNSETGTMQPGQYDILLLSIDQSGNKISIVAIKRAYEIVAGLDYTFTVSLGMTMQVSLGIKSEAPVDVALTGLILPSDTLGSSASEIKVKIQNRGKDPLTILPIALNVNDGTIMYDTFRGNIEPRYDPYDEGRWSYHDSLYTLSVKPSLAHVAQANVKAWISVEGDPVASNDTIKARLYNPVEVYNFPYTDDFAYNLGGWKSSNMLSADGAKWDYDVSTINNGTYGCASSNIWSNSGQSLTSRLRFNLGQGVNQISFDCRASAADENMSLHIYYGRTQNLSEMTMLEEVKINNSEWEKKGFNVVIPDNYGYYFAFVTPSTGKFIYIDNFMANKGSYVGVPDIALISAGLPEGGCDAPSSHTISVEVANNGSDTLIGFTLNYKINENEAVTQNFTDTILIGASKTVEFTQTADFSAYTTYNIVVSGSCEGQLIFNNDTLRTSFTTLEEAEVPYNVDFFEAEDAELFTPQDNNSWEYTNGAWSTTSMAGYDVPLMSGCIAITDTGNYILEFEAEAGTVQFSVPQPKDFYVSMGKKGTATSEWTHIKDYSGESTEGIKTYIVEFHIAEAGTYRIGFAEGLFHGGKGLTIHTVDIKKKPGTGVSVEMQQALADVSLFPNPSEQGNTITVKAEELRLIQVYNVAGSKVFESPILNVSEYELNTASFGKGVYFASVKTENGTRVIKFIVK